ncbi:hypothetical protein [Afifella aestuarii]|uniref:hypothetical protein n=1 Tax=Afifella aestuarii TaxID=1909496 RepID=UPI001FE88E66|nr:hypothetical protein [Afifella aestuarii]
MLADIGDVMVFDADGIFPKPPGQIAKFGMADRGLIMDLRSHRVLVAANGIPIQLIALDFKYFSGRRVTNPRNASTINFHVRSRCLILTSLDAAEQPGKTSMSYRNKPYIAFDGDNDMHYYRLMTAWKAHGGNSFNCHNAHLFRQTPMKYRLRMRDPAAEQSGLGQLPPDT